MWFGFAHTKVNPSVVGDRKPNTKIPLIMLVRPPTSYNFHIASDSIDTVFRHLSADSFRLRSGQISDGRSSDSDGHSISVMWICWFPQQLRFNLQVLALATEATADGFKLILVISLPYGFHRITATSPVDLSDSGGASPTCGCLVLKGRFMSKKPAKQSHWRLPSQTILPDNSPRGARGPALQPAGN